VSRWRIVAAMVLAMSVSGPSIANYSFGILLKGVVDDLHWTRGGASGAISLYLIGLAISVPIYGALVDRFGARRPALASITLFALLLAATATVTNQLSFRILLGVTGFVAGGTTVIPYVVTIASRFESRRGLALGIGAAGIGLGGIVVPPLLELLTRRYGWRGGFFELAVLVPLIALPCALLTLNPRPAFVQGRSAESTVVRVAPWRVRAFWVIAVAVLLICVGVGGVMIHAVSILTDRGTSRQIAAQIVSFIALGTVVGRVGGGYLMDRFHAPYIAAGFFLLAATALGLLLAAPPAGAIVGLLGIGITVGSESDVIAFLSARYLKLPGLGRANGLLMLTLAASNALGVAILGYLFDAFHSYAIGLSTGIVLALAAALVIARLGPYPALAHPPAQPR
jgi:MFS family permease